MMDSLSAVGYFASYVLCLHLHCICTCTSVSHDFFLMIQEVITYTRHVCDSYIPLLSRYIRSPSSFPEQTLVPLPFILLPCLLWTGIWHRPKGSSRGHEMTLLLFLSLYSLERLLFLSLSMDLVSFVVLAMGSFQL